MSELTKELINEAIKGYVEPHLEKDLVDRQGGEGRRDRWRQGQGDHRSGFPRQGLYG